MTLLNIILPYNHLPLLHNSMEIAEIKIYNKISPLEGDHKDFH